MTMQDYAAALVETVRDLEPQYKTKAPCVNLSESDTLRCCVPNGERYTMQPINRAARNLERRARAWLVDNPTAYARLIAEVKQAAEKNALFKPLPAILFIQEQAAADGVGFTVDASLFPALERIICEDAPECSRAISLSPSVFELAYRERHRLEFE